MIDPKLFASIPFNNKTAWTDFLGQFALYHHALADRVGRTLGTSYRVYPLGDGGGPEWLGAVQQTHQNAAQALALSPPPDLQDYALDDASDFASWTFAISQDLTRLRIASGLS